MKPGDGFVCLFCFDFVLFMPACLFVCLSVCDVREVKVKLMSLLAVLLMHAEDCSSTQGHHSTP